MSKVAYNACFGGFSLSKEAVMLGRELSGNNRWAGVTLKGERYYDGGVSTIDYGVSPHIERNDVVLIEVIERLGRDANGPFALLKLRELPSGTRYRIDEYDGNESVITIDEYDWSVAK